MYSLCIQWIQPGPFQPGWNGGGLDDGQLRLLGSWQNHHPVPWTIWWTMGWNLFSFQNIYQVNTFHYWFMMIMMIHLAISLDKFGSCSAKNEWCEWNWDTLFGRDPAIPTMGPCPRTGSEDWWCHCTSRRRNWYRWCFVPLPQGKFPEDRRTLATGCHTMWQNIYSVPSHICGYAR